MLHRKFENMENKFVRDLRIFVRMLQNTFHYHEFQTMV